MSRLFDEVSCLINNPALLGAMRENLARVDALNDTSKIIEDLRLVAGGAGEK